LALYDGGGGTGLPTGLLALGERQLSPDRLAGSLALELAEDIQGPLPDGTLKIVMPGEKEDPG